MVSHLCFFSVPVHAAPNADHKWAPADTKAAAGLQFAISVHAVPSTEHAWVLADMNTAAGLHFTINVHADLYADHTRAPAGTKVAAALQRISAQLLFPKSVLSCTNGLRTNLAKEEHDKCT